MRDNPDLLTRLETFVHARKEILGAEQAYVWVNGFNQHERKAIFPIALSGESPAEARLELVGFPQARSLKFRLSLCWTAAVCRLDFTDETHMNTFRIVDDGVPARVTGPHYHSWSVNRRFFARASEPPILHNAVPFTMTGTFDAILRWFCQDTNIDQPGPRHLIELPSRDRLL